jgi:hypothetical protein
MLMQKGDTRYVYPDDDLVYDIRRNSSKSAKCPCHRTYSVTRMCYV